MPEGEQPNLEFLLMQAQTARLENRLDEASQFLLEAFNLDPQSIPALMEEALIHQQLNHWPEARRCLEIIIQTQPENTQVLNALGITWQSEGKFVKAIEQWEKITTLNPDHAEAWQNVGLAYEHLNNLPRAIAAHQKVVALIPENARAHRLLGMAQLDYGLLPAANKCFDQALKLDPVDPENRWQRFFIRALAGDFPNAWTDYECRFELPGRTTPDHGFDQPRWQGDSLPNKTLLLHAEQGYGDTLQTIRYAPRAAERVGNILLWVPSPLAGLMQSVADVNTVTTKKPDAASFDVHLPLMSLPGIFEDSLETIPKTVPYIGTSPPLPSTDKPKKIGIAWAGSGNQPLDRRSIPVEVFKPLLNKPNIEFHSLQLNQLTPSSMKDHQKEMTDFMATAKLVQNLDLVISVDTSIAHLAGALGKPVWILLSFAPDWRWGHESTFSQWYPSAQLFRQNYGEAWEEVINRICTEI